MAIGFTFEGVASLINILIFNLFLDDSGIVALGFAGIQYMYASFSLVALIILFFYNDKKVDLRDLSLKIVIE